MRSGGHHRHDLHNVAQVQGKVGPIPDPHLGEAEEVLLPVRRSQHLGIGCLGVVGQAAGVALQQRTTKGTMPVARQPGQLELVGCLSIVVSVIANH